MIMKTNVFIITALLCLASCVSQQVPCPCDDLNEASQVPWLNQLIQEGESQYGAKLETIERITYALPDESTATQTGFYVTYEPKCCDIPGSFIYDCDGSCITFYGGIAGCNGECGILILSRETIYSNIK